MTDITQSLPAKRLTDKEKIADDFAYFKDTANYYITGSSFPDIATNQIGYNVANDEVNLMIGLYNNEIPAEWFSHITNPLGVKQNNIPAKVRQFNILKPNIDYMVSTYGRRALQFTVTNNSKEAYNDFLEKKKEYAATVARQRFVQMVQGKQVDNTPEKLIDDFASNYKDTVASKTQAYLDGLITKYDIHEKFKELFLNYLLYGKPCSYKGITNDKLVYRRVDSRNLCSGYSSTGYIEDADWAVEIHQMTMAQFSDEFYDILDEKIWKKIDEQVPKTGLSVREYIKKTNVLDNNIITIHNVVWKGLKKIKIVYFLDEFGQPDQREEDDEYKPTKEEYVEEKWIPQLYRATRCGKDLFLRMGEYPYAISTANNINGDKLPYNGITYGYKTDKVFSLLKAGVSYLVLVLICHLTIEKMMAKHKGKILIMDWWAIPKTHGWDEEKFMKYAENLGWAFVDRSQAGVDRAFNQYSSIDMSTIGDIMQLQSLADSYEEKWDRASGIPRQLKGQTFASDEVGTTKQAITQSSISVDYIFQKFAYFELRELQGFMELSKLMTLNGHQELIDNDEYGAELLNIAEGELLANLGIKASNASQDLDNLNQAKQYIQSVNQQDPSLVLETLACNSMAQLKGVINKMQRKYAEQSQQEHENAKEMEQIMNESKKELLEFENMLGIERDNNEYDRKIEIEAMNADVALATAEAGVNPEVIEDNNNDGQVNSNDILTKDRDRVSKERMHQQDMQFKREELGAKVTMAREKNATDLKNKVVGERSKSK